MPGTATKVGLRIDVDTFRGTRDGVPRLLSMLAERHILATFFFCLGPDNMGRHVRRLLRPAFLWKMLRSNAPGLYGWQVLFSGTFWPGRHIGRHLGDVIRATQTAGHEVGLHAWDHHKWQIKIEKMSSQQIHDEIGKAFDAIQNITGTPPCCSAAAGWRCTEQALLEKDSFGFHYNSDCRGTSIFRPAVNGNRCAPQIPVTLPTYDELIGRDGVTDANYNEALLALIKPERLNVLTIHAEVEGISKAGLFEHFLAIAKQRNIVFVPLSALLPDMQAVPDGSISLQPVPGREGTLCIQAE